MCVAAFPVAPVLHTQSWCCWLACGGLQGAGSVCLDVINQTWSPMFDLVNVFETFLPQASPIAPARLPGLPARRLTGLLPGFCLRARPSGLAGCLGHPPRRHQTVPNLPPCASAVAAVPQPL